MFCPKCKSGQHTRQIHESTRYAMQYIISTPEEKLFTFQLSEAVLQELSKLMREYMQHYVRHEFKSLQILEDLMLK